MRCCWVPRQGASWSPAHASSGCNRATRRGRRRPSPGPTVPATTPARPIWWWRPTASAAPCAARCSPDGVRSCDTAAGRAGERSWTTTALPRGGFAPYWGPSTEFGAVRISDRRVYWYGYFRHPAEQPLADELGAAIEMFSDWAPEVRATVAATDPARLLRHDVHHLAGGPPTYVRGRTVLIGDAAHAMLPTMGQGANTSLEDGISVGRLIAQPVDAGMPLQDALAAFDRARRPRCRQVAARSRQTARFGAHVPGGIPQVVRNAVLRAVPAGPAVAASTAFLRWQPQCCPGAGSWSRGSTTSRPPGRRSE